MSASLCSEDLGHWLPLGQLVNKLIEVANLSHCFFFNLFDADTDDDGIADGDERDTDPLTFDSDGDGLSDSIEVGGDPNAPRNSDGDSIIDALDEDSDNDTLPDAQEGRIDSDEDGLFNYQDADDDNDSLPTQLEVLLTGNLGMDVDGDSRANYLDLDADGARREEHGHGDLGRHAADQDVRGHHEADLVAEGQAARPRRRVQE